MVGIFIYCDIKSVNVAYVSTYYKTYCCFPIIALSKVKLGKQGGYLFQSNLKPMDQVHNDLCAHT